LRKPRSQQLAKNLCKRSKKSERNAIMPFRNCRIQ
jgi:hypothetical protein